MRLKLRILPLGLATLAVAAAAFGLVTLKAEGSQETTPPKLLLACGTCHSMEKEVQTWEKSPHGNITCLACHKEGDVNWVRHEVFDKNADMAAVVAAAKAHPIELKVPDDRCQACHEPQMSHILKDMVPAPVTKGKTVANVGQPMAINAAHEVHIKGKAALSCNECHFDSAHGATLSATARKDEAHARCQTCHDQKNVTLNVNSSASCAACHTNVASVLPVDHKDTAKWQQSHGKASTTQSCGACHLADQAGPHTAISRPASFPTTRQDACNACHSGVAMPHPDSFLAEHGQKYLTVKSGTCESCHTPEKNPIQPTPAHATASYCTDCHLQPMPHPASFLSVHGQTAQKAAATCDACHSTKNAVRPTAYHASSGYCMNCHDTYQHDKGWVAGHGTEVDNSCSTCHTLQGQTGQHNACSACHTSNGAWHPNMWFIKHGAAAQQQGEASCAVCHDEVKPSCAQCHRGR